MIEIYYIDKKIKKGNINELAKLKDKKIWVDITNISKQESILLGKTFNLHHLTIEDIFNSNVRIKIEEFPEYLFCVFYGIRKTKQIELLELDFLIGSNFIITNHKKDIGSYNELKKDGAMLESLFAKGNEFVFHKLLDMEIDNYFPILETIDDQIELIEEKVTQRPTPELLQKIFKLKRSVVLIKKATFPQREKISFLAKNEYKHISKKSLPYFRDIYDHAIRVSDAIDNYREAISNTFDVYMSAVSNNMNEVMKTLSIIATIALPLTVISGIYGTNFSVLPGQHFAFGFWVMIAFMIMMVLGMLYYFRRKNWF
ncbi:MAG: magnesium/cobalt transporter CorA [Nanoarchaeota archaeon]